MGGAASLLICMFLGPRFIDYLRLKEFGQQIREEGPAGHHGKAGTPTMGGLILFLGVAVTFVILAAPYEADDSWAAVAVLGTVLASAALGFVDDWTKISKKRSLGVRARTKIAVQVLISLGLWYVATEQVGLSSELRFRVFDASEIGRASGRERV